MPKLPVVSGVRLVRLLQDAGWVYRRTSGSHVVLTHPDSGRTVAVPVHGSQDLPKGTLAGILRDAGMSGEELGRLLGK